MSTGTATGEWARLQGQSVYDNAGQKIGDIQRVFFDQANEPAWVAVQGRRIGTREALVPLTGSQMGPNGLAVAVGTDVIRAAPEIEAGNELNIGDAAQLNRYYESALAASPSTQPPAQPPAQPAPREQMANRPDQNRATELTSYEEQLRVGTEAVQSGAVRLHKYVSTEQAESSVPIRHEEVRVERVPATGAPVPDGHRFEDQAVEVTLHEERPTVAKETVPVETVRLATETRTDDRKIADELHRERIEIEDQRPGSEKDMRSR
jgi:uncharacterized protein (TIGR02271 family)